VRPRLSGWIFFSLVAVLAFLGMVFVRTSLDRSTIELARLEQNLAEARSLNQRLRLEIARLESPARIAPLAQGLGMVYPQSSQRLIVEGVHQQTLSDPRWADLNRFAAGQLAESADGHRP
jgi:cell division protein FtsL